MGYNGFLTDFPDFYRFSKYLTTNDKFVGAPVIVIVESQSQSGWHLNEDIKMSHPVSFGHLIIINSPFCTYITAKKCQKTILQQNMGNEAFAKK